MTTTLTPAPRTYGWRSWADVGREALLGVFFGCIVTLIESGGMKAPQPPVTYIRNAILGVAITFMARLLETILSWALEQSRIATVFRAMIYAVGGWIGYFLGLALVGA